MLPKFHVLGDSSANNFFSSSIIVNNLNNGAKEAGLFDENGLKVVYSTTADQMGHNADAILCVYETAIPIPIYRNAGGKPLIGCSLHNLFFTSDVYPANLVSFCHLGVDSKLFTPLPKVKRSKFRFLCLAESNARSGIDVLLKAFCETFPSDSNVELYLKDRGATETFKQFVKSISYGSSVIHDTENTQNIDELKKLYSESDIMVFPSRSTTWGLTITEAMSMGLPVITMAYAGGREVMADEFNGWLVNYKIELMREDKIKQLTEWGFRNHMFPLASYLFPPYWAEPDPEHLKQVLLKSVSAPEYPYLSRNARLTAENYSWEKGAASLSCALKKVCNNS